MNQDWPTRDEDLHTARCIMEQYADKRQTESLGLFEIVVNQAQKRMDFRLSGWVLALARHFVSEYGSSQGDHVTRQVISTCITQGNTIH